MSLKTEGKQNNYLKHIREVGEREQKAKKSRAEENRGKSRMRQELRQEKCYNQPTHLSVGIT